MLRISKLLRRAWNPLVSSVRYYPLSKTFMDMLRLYPEPTYSYMPNGITVATEERPGCEHVCFGLFIDGGSRYECQFENGTAHFFEHIAYRSTCARDAAFLRRQMNNTGARFKCFTSRELVVYYVECLAEDITIVVDLITDCVFNNAFDCYEIERQKEIVYKEMLCKENDPNSVLFDYLHGAAFNGTPMAQTVMGPTGNLYNFRDETIRTYLKKFFEPTRVVVAAVGGICHAQIFDLAQCYLLRLEPSKCVEDYYRFTAADFRFRDDAMPFCNAAIAFEAPCFCDNRRWTMAVAAMYIGGWDRSQPRGYFNANNLAHASFFGDQAHSFRSFYIMYKDTGLWGIHFLADRVEVDSLLYNIQSNFMNLVTTITKNEVDRAKHELKTKLLTKMQSTTASCLDLGRWTLYYGRRPMVHEQLSEIDSVTVDEMRKQCDFFIYDRCVAIAAVGAVEGLPHNTRIRAGNTWLRL